MLSNRERTIWLAALVMLVVAVVVLSYQTHAQWKWIRQNSIAVENIGQQQEAMTGIVFQHGEDIARYAETLASGYQAAYEAFAKVRVWQGEVLKWATGIERRLKTLEEQGRPPKTFGKFSSDHSETPKGGAYVKEED